MQISDGKWKVFLKALDKSLGNISLSCKTIDISRVAFYDKCKRDKKFASKVEEIKESVGDFVESKLVGRIRDDDTTAIIFYCKTKLKERGYVEKKETVVSGDKDNPLIVNGPQAILDAISAKYQDE